MLATLADFKIFLNIDSADTSQDTFLTSCLTNAGAIVERYLNRKIEAADYDEKYDGGGNNFIILNYMPINSISSLKDGDDTISVDDYVYYADSGIVKLKSGYFEDGIQNVQISYNAGYTTVPDVIEEATLEIAALLYKGSDAGEGRLGKASISIPEGGGTLSFVNKLPDLVLLGLRSYRKVNL